MCYFHFLLGMIRIVLADKKQKQKKTVFPRLAYILFRVACVLLSDTPLVGVWSLRRTFVLVWTASRYKLELSLRASSQWEASRAAALAAVGKNVAVWLCGWGCLIRWVRQEGSLRWPGPRGMMFKCEESFTKDKTEWDRLEAAECFFLIFSKWKTQKKKKYVDCFS